MKTPVVLCLATLLAPVAAPASARAEPDLFSRNTVSGVADVRIVAADGERSWLDGGFGKLRYGDEAGVRAAALSLAWKPRLTDALAAVVALEAQDGVDPAVGVSEAYLTWRGDAGGLRLSGRAGLYWPQVSLEHDGLSWTVTDTLTPSAINSWLGEEGKVAGAEVTGRTALGEHEVAATVGVFGYGDSSGTLLSFRGWALHDLKATGTSVMPLPPLSAFMTRRQAPFSTSILELDDQPGVYGRLEWRPARGLSLSLFGYDNAGDRTSASVENEWAWDTRFANLGVDWRPDGRTHLRAQALRGTTAMGFVSRTLGQVWVDVDFSAAYVSLTRDLGPGAATARIDLFRADDRSLIVQDNNDEDGTALTLAYRWDLAGGMNLTTEAVRVESDRPSRALAGLAARQDQTQVQTALRYEF